MVEAHTESVMLLGRPFSSRGRFDFRRQDITSKVRSLIPIMLRYRLTVCTVGGDFFFFDVLLSVLFCVRHAPPRETNSLHRKLSGTFLLCARLGARIDCRGLFLHYSDQFRRRT